MSIPKLATAYHQQGCSYHDRAFMEGSHKTEVHWQHPSDCFQGDSAQTAWIHVRPVQVWISIHLLGVHQPKPINNGKRTCWHNHQLKTCFLRQSALLWTTACHFVFMQLRLMCHSLYVVLAVRWYACYWVCCICFCVTSLLCDVYVHLY